MLTAVLWLSGTALAEDSRYTKSKSPTKKTSSTPPPNSKARGRYTGSAGKNKAIHNETEQSPAELYAPHLLDEEILAPQETGDSGLSFGSSANYRESAKSNLGEGSGLPALERVELRLSRERALISRPPRFNTSFAGKLASLTSRNEFVFFTVNPSLQAEVRRIIAAAPAKHAAIVVIDPSSGKILAAAGKSPSINNIEFHTGFPAASLFKVVTAAAAIETNAIAPESTIRFRGGNYTLTKANYLPSSKSDKRVMTVGEALGKSVNPVFGRLALQHVGAKNLRRYAAAFGFNTPIDFDTDIDTSDAFIPEDQYELSRTGAGFGSVHVSPLHAASMMAAIVNNGRLLRPYFVDKVVSPTGRVLYRGIKQEVRSIVAPRTASTLLEMMNYTITIGTSRRDFMYKNSPVFPFTIAGKTGTLRGNNPKGLNSWFIAAPVDRPRLALAVVTVDPMTHEAKASYLGRKVFEAALDLRM